jgi:hypothetical protein
MTESKRIKNFRQQLVKETPKVPNDKATKTLLEQKPLEELLVINLSWRVRFIANRPRNVSVQPTATSDPRWVSLQPSITYLLNKVRAGDDLTPHLSLQPQSRGFSAIPVPKGKTVTWDDKDLLLNATGMHHFHLGTTFETAGHIARTNDVLFAAVSRSDFSVVGIYDHQVFEDPSPTMTAERARLWQTYEDLQTAGQVPGQASMGGLGGIGTSMSGHPTIIVRVAQEYCRVIRQVDAQLEDVQFLAKLYAGAGLSTPSKPKLTWTLNYLDLGLLDKDSQQFLTLRHGPS